MEENPNIPGVVPAAPVDAPAPAPAAPAPPPKISLSVDGETREFASPDDVYKFYQDREKALKDNLNDVLPIAEFVTGHEDVRQEVLRQWNLKNGVTQPQPAAPATPAVPAYSWLDENPELSEATRRAFRSTFEAYEARLSEADTIARKNAELYKNLVPTVDAIAHQTEMNRIADQYEVIAHSVRERNKDLPEAFFDIANRNTLAIDPDLDHAEQVLVSQVEAIRGVMKASAPPPAPPAGAAPGDLPPGLPFPAGASPALPESPAPTENTLDEWRDGMTRRLVASGGFNVRQ